MSVSAPAPSHAQGTTPLLRQWLGDLVPKCGDRALFPTLLSRAYLSHAAISPASLAVTRAVNECLTSVSERGVESFPIWAAQRERLRHSIGTLLGVSAQEVTLSPGCTRGITDLALSLPWREGEVVLTYRGEFPANVVPWQLAAGRVGARVELMDLPSPKQADCAEQILSNLEKRLSQGDAPRWLTVSAVQFQTGLAMPLERMAEICARRRTRIFVDGIQASGVLGLDVSKIGVDAFFVGAHKWLLGLEGAGFAYYRSDLMDQLSPITAGWLSSPGAEDFLFKGPGHLRYNQQLRNTPQVFEGSTANAVGFTALEAGVEVINHLGQAAIFEHVNSYHDAVEPQLVGLGLTSLRAVDPDLRSGILSFEPPEGVDVTLLLMELRKRGVQISIPDGLIRLAPHFSNALDEVPHVVSAFKDALLVASP